MLTFKLPNKLPSAQTAVVSGGGQPVADPFSLYDIAINGLQFELSNNKDNPLVRETAPFEKQRIDQETTAGEQTLLGWWQKSQDSFNGGAGQLQLEPAFPTPFDHIRYDLSRNVDVSVPGQVTRLPDMAIVAADVATQIQTLAVSGLDAVAYLIGTTVKLATHITGTPVVSSFAPTAGDPIQSITTDGSMIYASSATQVWSMNPNSLACVLLATFPSSGTSTVGWAMARLMVGWNNTAFALDVSQTGVTLNLTTSPYLLYTHPTAAYRWRCFAETPTAIVGAGDAAGLSTVNAFTLVQGTTAPTLAVAGQMAKMPIGETILSMYNAEGTYLALGTTAGVRIGQFEPLYSKFSYGPLELLPTDPTIPCVALTGRSNFVYAAGKAYDEAGLIKIDLGLKVDGAGRFAWAPDLITPTANTNAALAVGLLPVSNRIVFSVTGQGILLEGVGAGTGREAWIRTSRIRYNTTEPKLFKFGRVRGSFTAGDVNISAITPAGQTLLLRVGNVLTDPDEFRLPSASTEWMQLLLQIDGATTVLKSYGVKALPGTPRQRILQFVVSIADNETSKTGQRARQALSTRARLNALEALDRLGDEVVLQEFTPSAVVTTRVVIDKVSFVQIGRPNKRSDLGGNCTITLRTVES